jgi:hypothetical protein
MSGIREWKSAYSSVPAPAIESVYVLHGTADQIAPYTAEEMWSFFKDKRLKH